MSFLFLKVQRDKAQGHKVVLGDRGEGVVKEFFVWRFKGIRHRGTKCVLGNRG